MDFFSFVNVFSVLLFLFTLFVWREFSEDVENLERYHAQVKSEAWAEGVRVDVRSKTAIEMLHLYKDMAAGIPVEELVDKYHVPEVYIRELVDVKVGCVRVMDVLAEHVGMLFDEDLPHQFKTLVDYRKHLAKSLKDRLAEIASEESLPREDMEGEEEDVAPFAVSITSVQNGLIIKPGGELPFVLSPDEGETEAEFQRNAMNEIHQLLFSGGSKYDASRLYFVVQPGADHKDFDERFYDFIG